jgi:hypothetical protein
MYHKAADEIERKGGKILDVQLDYELKEKLYQRLGRALAKALGVLRFRRLLRRLRRKKRNCSEWVLSNCAVDAVNVYPTYRKPFDMILGRAKTWEWWTRGDSNPRPPHCEQWGK